MKKRMLRRLAFGLCLCVSVFTASCASPGGETATAEPTGEPRPTPRLYSDEAPPQGSVLNSFSLDLLRQMNDGSANVMLCTKSLGVSLGLLRIGASGETAGQIDTALGFTGLTEDGLLSLLKGLHDGLTTVNGLELTLKRGLYVGEGPTVKEKYVSGLATLNTPVTLIDFSDPVTLEIINDWAGHVAGGRVERLFEELSDETNMLLIDNVLFSGQWLRAFDPNATASLPFTMEGSHPVVVSMMYGETEFARYTGQDAECAFLPLDGGAAELWILLPPENGLLKDFVDGLTPAKISQWRSQAVEQVWRIKLPRLSLDWNGRLDDAFKAMGITDLYAADTAALENMGEGLALSQVRHRVQFSMDETGNLEAVLHSPELQTSSQADDMLFSASRPFAILVVDSQTQAILFAGTVYNPLVS